MCSEMQRQKGYLWGNFFSYTVQILVICYKKGQINYKKEDVKMDQVRYGAAEKSLCVVIEAWICLFFSSSNTKWFFSHLFFPFS